MEARLYTRLPDGIIAVDGRTPKSNPNRNGQRYEKLLAKRGLSLEDVTTYMEVDHVGINILFSYKCLDKQKGTWVLSANHAQTTICLGPMSYEETRTETVDICRRLGVCRPA
jgi:hypothetical protein